MRLQSWGVGGSGAWAVRMGGAESSFRQEKAPLPMTHRNAPLTPQGRYRLVMRVQAGRPIAHVAAEAGIARATLSKWVARYRQKGISELEDRSSAPFHCPTRTSAETVGSTHFEH